MRQSRGSCPNLCRGVPPWAPRVAREKGAHGGTPLQFRQVRTLLFGTSSGGFVLLLLLSQITPTGVLLGFGGIRIFIALKPKPEPIDIALLRCHSVERFLQDVLTARYVDKIDRLLLLPQRSVNLPLRSEERR